MSQSFSCGAPDGECEVSAQCGAQGFCQELARVSAWGQCRWCGKGRPLDKAGNVREHRHYSGRTIDPWPECQGSGRPPAVGGATVPGWAHDLKCGHVTVTRGRVADGSYLSCRTCQGQQKVIRSEPAPGA